MERIPRAHELTPDEMVSLRSVVAGSFTPSGQINRLQQKRLIELGLIQCAMGGLMPTPTGRIVARR
jgi:hypothetical protein